MPAGRGSRPRGCGSRHSRPKRSSGTSRSASRATRPAPTQSRGWVRGLSNRCPAPTRTSWACRHGASISCSGSPGTRLWRAWLSAPLELHVVHPGVRNRERCGKLLAGAVRGPADGERRLHTLHAGDVRQPVAKLLRFLRGDLLFGPRKKDQELVASPSEDEVRFPHARSQVVRDELQDVVADRVPHPVVDLLETVHVGQQDRKSTRLNSSHVEISYAVFCLKKKKPLKQHIACHHNLTTPLLTTTQTRKQ